MQDGIIYTARSFADFYGISRERLARIIAISRRDRGGVFGLAGHGYFKAELVAPKRMEITSYNATRAEKDATPLYPLKGTLDVSPVAVQHSVQSQPAPAAASDAPSKYELELRVLQERATALRQKNILEQARLREETVSYCSTAIQLILASLRADIDSIRLDPSAAARLRQAIDDSLADLNSVLPAIIDGTPVERIELELSARRAERITASRFFKTQLEPTASASEAERAAQVETPDSSAASASEAERTTQVETSASSASSASEAERTAAVEEISS